MVALDVKGENEGLSPGQRPRLCFDISFCGVSAFDFYEIVQYGLHRCGLFSLSRESEKHSPLGVPEQACEWRHG